MIAEFISKCGNYKVVIEYDEDCDSPDECDCLYSGFSFVLPSSARRHFSPSNSYDLEDFESYDYEKEEDIPPYESLEKEFGKGNVFSLYAYIHGGIKLSLSSGICTCPWDSGQLGFLVFEPEKNECLDDDSKKDHNKIEELAISYIETYDKYVNGEIFMYNIYEREPLFNGDGEEVDDDWNFIGGCCGYYDEKDCIESAFSELISQNPEVEFSCSEYREYIGSVKK